MVQITIDLPEDINKSVELHKVFHSFKTKEEAIIDLLSAVA